MLRALPAPIGAAAAAAAGGVLELRSGDRRSVVEENLRHVLGPGVGPEELARSVRRAFASYGRYWADAASLDPRDRHPFACGLTVDGVEHLRAAHRAGKGAVVALPHLGSWEIGAVWAAEQGFPLTTVAEPVEPPELFAWLVSEREALGMRVLPLGASAVTELLAVLRRGGFVALLADRDVAGDGVEVELFGARTTIPGGPAALSLRSGAPLVPVAIYLERGGAHRIVVRPPIPAERAGRMRADVARLSQRLAHELEVLVRLAPEQWHVFQPNWPATPPRLASHRASEAPEAPEAPEASEASEAPEAQ